MKAVPFLITLTACIGVAHAQPGRTADDRRLGAELHAALEAHATLPAMPPALPQSAASAARTALQDRAFRVTGEAHRTAKSATERGVSATKRARAEALMHAREAGSTNNGRGQGVGQAASTTARDNAAKNNAKSSAKERPPRP